MNFVFFILFLLSISIEDELNIFVVPHSHTEPGWLQTKDEYFVKV